ncbi:hypothetical protein A3I56_01555 [Candidatus Roizmanbacteria bacterium RIFCSPLOWO2_02_FULL_43_10]|uniref:Band 7 domain-containing protein n=3 Tax=Candidatus Roizmaniibacteriota TaxID=1752723 RepID=A0A1F7JXB9_9BACT|nr:MAG: hypothetical protein A3D08_02750 [Candidatus Roizmanbacteria bacterium RIFCSPHIGHO2_02_FULL_43_11]OGK60235.1 MAG: hypothetical protein A3I56_01555 [Candidatus Roizmanbacteria bacterium RIFCSPLOWO2_02_FULL_43_10]
MRNAQGALRFFVTWAVFLGLVYTLKMYEGWDKLFTDNHGAGFLPWDFDIIGIVVVLFKLGLATYAAQTIGGMIYVVMQYERGMVFRNGNFERVANAGIVIMPPWFWGMEMVDVRAMNLVIEVAQIMTKDNVPVKIKAVVFFAVDKARPQDSVLEVEDFAGSIEQVAEAAIKSMGGESTFKQMQAERKALGTALRTEVAEETKGWGAVVQSVLIQDVAIDSEEIRMSLVREAAAQAEALARGHLAEAEVATAESFVKAANLYAGNAVALMLRQLNIALEAVKGGKAVVLMPTSAMDGGSNLAIQAAMQQAAQITDGNTEDQA